MQVKVTWDISSSAEVQTDDPPAIDPTLPSIIVLPAELVNANAPEVCEYLSETFGWLVMEYKPVNPCDGCQKPITSEDATQDTDSTGDPDGDALCSECVTAAWEVYRGPEPTEPE